MLGNHDQTPAPILARLNAALHEALRDPEVAARLAQQGIEKLTSSPEECAAFIAAETAKWDAVVRAARIGEG